MALLRRFAHVLFGSLVVVTSASVGGCAADGGDDGAAPQLSDVTLEKTEIEVGKVETIKITVAYADDDGDVATVMEQATSPAGTSQHPNTLALTEAAGQKTGTHAFAMQLGSGAAGVVNLSFWLVDSKGHESAKVTKTLTVK